MFALFETLLRPTDSPKHPEPPAGLIAFFWHFARQAKWLFVSLFVVELFVALTDSAVPWFMGRIVTLGQETIAARLPHGVIHLGIPIALLVFAAIGIRPGWR